MNRIAIKHRLLDRGMTLAKLAARIEMPYDRLIRLVNGYRQPKPEEIDRIAAILVMPAEQLRNDTHPATSSE